MKKFIVIIAVFSLILGAGLGTALAKKNECATIQDGTIFDKNGDPISVGFDQYGYNYQARLFNGTYDGYDRNLDGLVNGQAVDYADWNLEMKWSEEWLSNKDCDGDGKLDRGDDGTSKGWLTNHVQAKYVDVDGSIQHYSYFCKIVWVGPGGSLWGQYEIIQEIINDTGTGEHGLVFKAADPGLGLYK